MRATDPVTSQQQFINSLTTAVVLINEALEIEYLNAAAEQFFATSLSQLLKQPVSVLLPNEEMLNELRMALAQQQGFTRREVHLKPVFMDSPRKLVDYSVSPFNEHGKDQLIIELHSLDRMMRISREDGLINAHQATRALVRGVAHEVKNPLGGIRGAAQLLERELVQPELQEYTQVIIAEADRLRNLVDQMLGPRAKPDFQWHNIHQVMERISSIIVAENGTHVKLRKDYDPSLPEIHADADQLIQASLNIARNGVQALLESTQQNTQPTLNLRTRALRQYTIGNKRHRLALCLEIQDNGPGIPEELQDTLFFPMVSGRAQGSGLGLSIAQAIVNQHQGLIECDSQPGCTVFRVILPYLLAEQSKE